MEFCPIGAFVRILNFFLVYALLFSSGAGQMGDCPMRFLIFLGLFSFFFTLQTNKNNNCEFSEKSAPDKNVVVVVVAKRFPVNSVSDRTNKVSTTILSFKNH